MPPRAGQLDQISEAIGELKGAIKSLDRYTHDHVHDVANVSQKMDAMSLEQAKRHEVLRLELSNQIEKGLTTMRQEIALVAARVAKLEEQKALQEGQMSVWKWLGDKWPFGALFAAIAAVVAWANGKIGI